MCVSAQNLFETILTSILSEYEHISRVCTSVYTNSISHMDAVYISIVHILAEYVYLQKYDVTLETRDDCLLFYFFYILMKIENWKIETKKKYVCLFLVFHSFITILVKWKKQKNGSWKQL